MQEFDHNDTPDISDILTGRRIVAAEMGSVEIPGDEWRYQADGYLALDDGTVLYLTGNSDCCVSYDLTKVATVDNIITSARVDARPAGDDYPDDAEGTYTIFVFADNQEINVAQFDGSDGNGYYGTGFTLTVVPAVAQ